MLYAGINMGVWLRPPLQSWHLSGLFVEGYFFRVFNNDFEKLGMEYVLHSTTKTELTIFTLHAV